MKIKLLLLFLSAFILFYSPVPAEAEIIHLDGIANAGWSADTLTSSHLYIYDTVNKTYFYKWVYSGADLPWSSREDLNADLEDGILNKYDKLPVANWQVQSGGDAFNTSNHRADQIWKGLSIAPGSYTLKLTDNSEAYQLNEFLWDNEGNYSTPIWNAYVQMYIEYNDGSNATFNFGDWSQAQGTEADVLALYHSATIDGMVLNLTKGGTIYFYINDYNSVDNGGSVSRI